MLLADRLTLDAPRRTKDGFMAVRAKAARAGVYDYLGAEVDPSGARFKASDTVKVYRPADEVFAADSVRSFIAKPITNDHPTEAVTAANWRDHSRGAVMGAMRDGDFLAFDLVLMDAESIAAIDAGKRELSNGYACDLAFEDGTAPDGTTYQAVQRNIRGNHVALVDRGRAGPDCRIADRFAACDANPDAIRSVDLNPEKPVKNMTIDGLTVDLANADTAAATVQTLIAARDAATTEAAGLKTQVATLTAEGVTKDAQIKTLEQQVKDAKPTPAQLRDAGKALMLAAGRAKALGVTVTDAMDEAQIMAATVTARMGDVAKDWGAAEIAASFAVLTKDVKAPGVTGVQSIVIDGTVTGDAATREAQAFDAANDFNAWRTKSAS